VRLTADRGDQRRDQIGDEGGDDRPERGTDDDGDRQVDEVAAHDEVAELGEHRVLPSTLASHLLAP
jgi:hypothetical protein